MHIVMRLIITNASNDAPTIIAHLNTVQDAMLELLNIVPPQQVDDRVQKMKQAWLDKQDATSSAPTTTTTTTTTTPADKLPTFFQNCTFFFDKAIAATVKKNLVRFVYAYDGQVEDSLTDEVTHVIAQTRNDSISSTVKQCKPDWIEACCKKQRRISESSYAL